MLLSLVLVHYHTPELAERAVASIHAELKRWSGETPPAEILLVDNGSTPQGRERLRKLDAILEEPGQNLGFAGGVNLGVARSRGEKVVIANPDLELLPGCLSALIAAVDAGAAVVGPRFFWDRSRRFLLPPTERRDRLSELAWHLAERSSAFAAPARRRWRRHARRHWNASTALPSIALSGALLAFPRTTWDAVGPFDTGYRLYFEETDWLQRVRARGLPTVHEPRAEVLHLHGRSAAAESRAAGWYAESAERYRRRWYGPFFRSLLRRLEVPHSSSSFPLRLAEGPPRLDLTPYRGAAKPLWIELSPLARGFPAAAERLAPGTTHWELPDGVWKGMAAGTWQLQVVDDHGRERLRTSFERPEVEV